MVDLTQRDDQELIRLIEQGNDAALSELYDRYSRLVYSVALHMVGDGATAEEITLDVFTRTWQKAHTYRSERGQVNTWLTSLARYRAIDQLRRRGSRPEHDAVYWADAPVEPTAPHNPEATTTRTLQQRRVRGAVAALPSEQREALALAYFGGYSQREVAEMLDLPLGTVKTRIRLAMKKLRFLLREEEEPA